MIDGRPRVALVAHEIHDHGGMERAAAELVRRTRDSVDFTLVSSKVATDVADGIRWCRVRTPRQPLTVRFPVFAAGATWALRSIDVDLVHSVGVNTVGTKLDAVTFQWCHAGAIEAMGGRAPATAPTLRRANTAAAKTMALWAERRAMASRPLALAVSPGVGREVTRHYPGTEVAVTPNGIDPARFRPDAAIRRSVRDEQGVADQTVVILFVGGDWDRKGLPAAIAGVGGVRRRGHDVELWVVGDGPTERFGELASREGLAPGVRFLGRRSDAERFYAAADVFIAPTLYETFSIAGYEAAASGLPVVATRVNGLEDLVGDDEQRGRFVTSDGASVEAALTGLVVSPELRRTLGDEARRFATAYDWDRSARSVLGAYERLMADRRLAR